MFTNNINYSLKLFVGGCLMRPLLAFADGSARKVAINALTNATPQITYHAHGLLGSTVDIFLSSDKTLLSPLGSVLGEAKSIAVIRSAGPIVQIITSLALSYFDKSGTLATFLVLSSRSLTMHAFANYTGASEGDFSAAGKGFGPTFQMALSLAALTSFAISILWSRPASLKIRVLILTLALAAIAQTSRVATP